MPSAQRGLLGFFYSFFLFIFIGPSHSNDKRSIIVINTAKWEKTIALLQTRTRKLNCSHTWALNAQQKRVIQHVTLFLTFFKFQLSTFWCHDICIYLLSRYSVDVNSPKSLFFVAWKISVNPIDVFRMQILQLRSLSQWAIPLKTLIFALRYWLAKKNCVEKA